MKKPLKISQLELLAIHATESITSYNSIIIVVDSGSQTERLIWFLKSLTEFESHMLLAVNDHEGTVSFIWDTVPPRFQDGEDVELPDGDTWSILKNYRLKYDGTLEEV